MLLPARLSQQATESAEALSHPLNPTQVPTKVNYPYAREVDAAAEDRSGRVNRGTSTADEKSLSTEEQIQVIDKVRSRLCSAQDIVRRNRTKSSSTRDGMMGELDDMLDQAIATTTSPSPVKMDQRRTHVDSSNETPIKTMPPRAADTLRTRDSHDYLAEQAPSPSTNLSLALRRTGFPLTSPVKERMLL